MKGNFGFHLFWLFMVTARAAITNRNLIRMKSIGHHLPPMLPASLVASDVGPPIFVELFEYFVCNLGNIY